MLLDQSFQTLQRFTTQHKDDIVQTLKRHTVENRHFQSLKRRAIDRPNHLALYGTLCVGVFFLRFLAETKSTRVMLLAPTSKNEIHHGNVVAYPTQGEQHGMPENDDLLAHHELAALETDDFAFIVDDDEFTTNDSDEAAWLVLQQQSQAPFSIQDADVAYAYNSTRLKGMDELAIDFFNGNFCHRLLQPDEDMAVLEAEYGEAGNDAVTVRKTNKMISVRFNCQLLFERSSYGTGNYISIIYALRLAAARMGNVNIEFICNDAEQTKDDLILPWMTGWFPPAAAKDFSFDLPSISEVCGGYKKAPITHMIPAMQWELRRMAVALVGIPYAGHPAEAWAKDNLWHKQASSAPFNATLQVAVSSRSEMSAPIYQNVELDDAVLHFRCGDLIASNHPSFGFMKFGSFSRHVPKNVRTIGIVTQPFDASGQTRLYDGGARKQAKCKKVVYAFVEHLQKEFPEARVSVRNDAQETIALTFARMVMAQHVVVGISSFGAFPAVATFGTGYIRKPDYVKAPNRWLLHSPSIEEVVDNVKMVEEPKLMAIQCQKRWGKDGSSVIQWFKDYAME